MQRTWEAALAPGGPPYHVTLRPIDASGRPWIMEARGDLRRDDAGKAIGIFGTAQDVTERELAEEQSRQNEQFIRSNPDTVDEGFIVVDRDLRILTANDACLLQAGRRPDDVLGMRCYEAPRGERHPRHERESLCAVRDLVRDRAQSRRRHRPAHQARRGAHRGAGRPLTACATLTGAGLRSARSP